MKILLILIFLMNFNLYAYKTYNKEIDLPYSEKIFTFVLATQINKINLIYLKNTFSMTEERENELITIDLLNYFYKVKFKQIEKNIKQIKNN